MAKKKAKTKKTADTERLKKQALESAHRVWLAGLGALALAESEGSKLFGKLVERGEDMEKRGRPVVEKLSKKVGAAKADAEAKAGKVGDDAKAAWGKVESVVEDQVSATLRRLGIPTRDEIEALTKRVETLTEKLGAARGDAPAKPARKRATKKATTKKATAKNATAKKSAAKKAVAKKAVRRPAKKAARRAPAKRATRATKAPTEASSES